MAGIVQLHGPRADSPRPGDRRSACRSERAAAVDRRHRRSAGGGGARAARSGNATARDGHRRRTIRTSAAARRGRWPAADGVRESRELVAHAHAQPPSRGGSAQCSGRQPRTPGAARRRRAARPGADRWFAGAARRPAGAGRLRSYGPNRCSARRGDRDRRARVCVRGCRRRLHRSRGCARARLAARSP